MNVPYGLFPILALFFILGIDVKSKSISEQLLQKSAKTKKEQLWEIKNGTTRYMTMRCGLSSLDIATYRPSMTHWISLGVCATSVVLRLTRRRCTMSGTFPTPWTFQSGSERNARGGLGSTETRMQYRYTEKRFCSTLRTILMRTAASWSLTGKRGSGFTSRDGSSSSSLSMRFRILRTDAWNC